MSNYKVYCLTNNITGEKYIGVTKQKLYRRFKAGKGKRNQCGGYHWKKIGGVDNGNNN